MTILTEQTLRLPRSSRSDTTRQLLAILSEFLTLVALLIAVVAVVLVDIRILENRLGELSLTELLQSALVLGMVLTFVTCAYLNARSRGCLIAFSTLFACMLIRENDAFFDLIRHGFWVIPAGIIAVVGATCCYLNRDSLAEPFVRYFRTRHATLIHLGFLLLMVFSRLFGTGSLWQFVMGADYNAVIKTVVQEGLELLGYALMAYGLFMSSTRRPATI